MSRYAIFFNESGEVIGTNLTSVTTRGGTAPNGYAPAHGTPPVQRHFCNFKTNSTAALMSNMVSVNALDADANRDKFDVVSAFSYDAATAANGTQTQTCGS